jgi:hypothetical protein
MLNLIIFTKYGHQMMLTHNGDMASFLYHLRASDGILSDSGTWVPIASISHILPQIMPQVPGEMLGQVRTEGETKQ